MKNERLFGIDVIRIVSMIMIVFLHYFFNCSITRLDSFSLNFVITWLIEGLCYISVDLFILISGFFGVQSKKVNYKRIISLALKTWFYSYLFLIIALMLGTKMSISKLNVSLFPLINGHYWFITVYFILMIFQPLLNLIFKWMAKNENYYIIITLLSIFCIIPTFFPFSDANFKIAGGTNILWFITLYLVGGLIKKYEKKIDLIPNYKKFFMFIVCVLIPPIVKIGCMYFFRMNDGGAVFYHHNNLFITLSAILLFCIFKNIRINGHLTKKIIILLSNTTFGVYLIHENVFVKNWLWDNINNIQDINSNTWIIFVIFLVFSLYFICTFIEYIRSRLFDYFKVENKFNKMIDRLKSIKNLEKVKCYEEL